MKISTLFIFVKLFARRCKASFIVVCIVAWEGMPKHEADNSYRLLIHKLNKFGLPTTRRCATNENRTCACQGKSQCDISSKKLHSFKTELMVNVDL